MGNNAPSGGREHWSGQLGFVLAAAGSAIGLGNIWKFPYITGENGGGAFVLIYLACILLIGLPVMLCEIILGRHTQKNPVGAFKALAPKSSLTAHLFSIMMLISGIALICFDAYGWGIIFLLTSFMIFKYGWVIPGIMSVFAGFIILSYYSVVGGWTITYFCSSISGSLSFQNSAEAAAFFDTLKVNPLTCSVFHIAFMVITCLIIYSGVRKGIERWSRILMPALFIILMALILRGITLPGALDGVDFFLRPDFSKIKPQSVLTALGHAFFTLSLGMGAIITYGSYVSKNENLFKASLSIVGLDTLAAIMAGLAIFPVAYAVKINPECGPGLVFQTLPLVFAKVPLGSFWCAVFFLLLFIAALTSAMSLLEVVVSFSMDELKWTRHFATIVCGGSITLLGCFSAVSVSNWKNIEWLHSMLVDIFNTSQSSFFDFMDNLGANWLLPLAGLFIALFTGWIWGTKKAVDEMRNGSQNFADVNFFSFLAGLKDDPGHNSRVHVLTLASLWGIFVRFIAPAAILIAFLHTAGWIKY
ncbi:MAG: hypothetical protein A2020_05720 [Lentisphaerae bacterium GWF2_45_14]|nr:MAG: hypothetical protein A2020_05720 [Lentisphaerae bacterium GWF2_45_14]